MRVALAVVAASAILAATAVPAPLASVPQTRQVPQQIPVESVRTSVAVLPVAEVTPPAGSVAPEGSRQAREEEAPTPAVREPAEAPARHTPRLSAASLCLTPNSNPDCEATFAAALRPMLQPADVVVTASGSADIVGPRGAQPLHFQKHAPWVRRLETLGKEGIPFVRIPRGLDREVVVGINRKGVLGVSLHERHD